MTKVTIGTVEAWFTQTNWLHLRVASTSVLKTLGRLIPWLRVVDARFFPQFIGDDLLRVHLLFVTERILYHCFIGSGQVIYSEYPVINVTCRIELSYSESGDRIEETRLYFDVGELKDDGKPRVHFLAVPERARFHAIHLVSLINNLKAKEYGDI